MGIWAEGLLKAIQRVGKDDVASVIKALEG